MYKESMAMKEIHEIRVKHYEETRDLSSEERIKKINEGGRAALKIIQELKSKSRKVEGDSTLATPPHKANP